MNDFLKKNSFSILLVLVAMIIFWVYTTFINVPRDEEALAPQNPAEEITLNLSGLQSISFDNNLFSSPEFRNLREFPLIIPLQTLGRTNPFAPAQ
ncbi:MAG: hypothetical protein AAB587_02590 [Patescibacteria group bacterium]